MQTNAGYSQLRTPITDIVTEYLTMGPDEKNFVEAHSDFISAELVFRQAFDEFLLQTFQNDFIKAGGNGFADNKLLAIRKARQEYAQKNKAIFEDPEVLALIEKKRRQTNATPG